MGLPNWKVPGHENYDMPNFIFKIPIMEHIKMISRMTFSAFKQVNPPVPAKEWDLHFSSIKDDLSTLLDGPEEEFLHVGSCLQDFSVRARDLSETTASLSRLTSGDVIGIAINDLSEQLDKMSDYLNSNENNSGGSIEMLQCTMDTIKWMDGICDDFIKISRSLRYLSVSLQIQNARLGESETGFKTVSEDIKKLANLIEARSEDLKNNTVPLVKFVREAITKTQNLTKHRQTTTVNTLEDARESLVSLITLNKKSSEVSTRVERRSSDIYKNIGDVVSSLQFHDITRQQLEHVGEILDHMRERLDEAGRENGSMAVDKKIELTGWISNVCEILQSQLSNTRRELNGAVLSIIENLRGISKNVKDLANDTQSLSGDTHQSVDSLLSHIGEGIKSVILSLRENEKIEDEISTSVNKAMNGIEGFVNKIETISAEIKLVALNAQVQAVCLGEKGKTFVVIAGEIQKLSIDANDFTSSMLKKLKTVTDSTAKLQSGPHSLLDNSTTESGGMVNTLEKLLDSINGINEEFNVQLGRITNNGQDLNKEIDDISNRIVFHEEMAQTIDGISEGFSDIQDHVHTLFPATITYSSTDGLESLQRFYTTDSEKAIHGNVTNTTPVLIEDTTNKSDAEDDMGDNIELF